MSTLTRKRNTFIFVSLVIPVILLVLFVVYPTIKLFGMSTINWDGLSTQKTFVGFGNYIKMLGDRDLWKSLSNNAVYFFVHLAFIPVELAVAVMLSSKMRGAKFFKSMTFLPYVINGVAISYAFAYFYSPVNGGFNAVLSILGLEGLIRNWLSDSSIVNYMLTSVSLWRFSGYHVILFIAALTSVSEDILEAATIDGANAWQKFRFIQIPSIQLVIDFILFDNVRGALQAFDIPFVMTNGGPGYASSTFTLYTINTAFTYNNFGLASAMAVAIMVLIVVVYLIQNVVITGFRKRGMGGDGR
ncbi:MAG: sugar ABC transporter permease [Angelakisella sp.]